jgi:hypothetical protein
MNTSFQLSVPDPCGENWDRMAPRGNGSFCTSCEKVVVDFTRMTDQEVMQYMKANADRKVCGRFTEDQLGRPLSPSVNLDRSALKAFVYVLFLVFGASLFSYTVLNDEQHRTNYMNSSVLMNEQENKRHNEIVGVILVPVDSEQKEGLIHYTLGKPLPPPQPGDGLVTTETRECECGDPPPPPPSPPVEQYTTMGEPMMYVEQPLRDMEKDTVYLDELHVRGESNLYILGGPVCYTTMYDHVSIEGRENEVVENSDELALDAMPEPTLICFPNPSNGQVTIKYMVPVRTDVAIELYDLNGKCIMELVSTPQLYEGTYIFSLDLSGLDNGTYMCAMRAGEKVLAEKIVLSR